MHYRISLQEILDNIKASDGKSDVRIESDILESVLTALDARHMFGRYHPSMQTKARMDKLEGVNNGESLNKHLLHS